MDARSVVTVKVFKFNPDTDPEPRYETHEVPFVEHMRVLDVLEAITEDLGRSLTFRWFCGVKKCGKCAAQVNGKPCLTCWEPAEPEMVVEPLPGFPVLRDLVVDRNAFDVWSKKLDLRLDRGAEVYSGFPEFRRASELTAAERLMSCIECLLCVSVCPAYGPKFAGPASMVQLARFSQDPRDRADRARRAIDAGIEQCVSCYMCDQACPLHVPIVNGAIQHLRRKVLIKGNNRIARHQDAVKALILKGGLINPVSIAMKAMGVLFFKQIPKAVQMFIRGRLRASALFRPASCRLKSAPEVAKIEEALREGRE